MTPSHTPGRALARRSLLGLAAASLLGSWPLVSHAARAVPVEVWKDPDCGCCKDWVAHLQANGFQVKIHDTGNDAARTRAGIAPQYGSCHTARVGSYAIEGHVPAREIRRLLSEKPNAIGLAVPGMPVGSPGMDGPAYGKRRDAYNVMLLSRDGGASIYQNYPGNKS